MTYEARGRFEETFANVPGVTVSDLKITCDDHAHVLRWMAAVVKECTGVALEERIKFSVYEKIDDERVNSKEYFVYEGGENVSWNKVKI